MKKLISLAMAGVFAVSPLMAETVETVFEIEPQMNCKNCVAKIKNQLRFEKGVKNVKADLKTQTVIVTYDDEKTDIPTLRDSFAEIGYEVTPQTSDTEGACPDA